MSLYYTSNVLHSPEEYLTGFQKSSYSVMATDLETLKWMYPCHEHNSRHMLAVKNVISQCNKIFFFLNTPLSEQFQDEISKPQKVTYHHVEYVQRKNMIETYSIAVMVISLTIRINNFTTSEYILS